MSESSVLVEKTGPVAHVALNRPDVHNAFNGDLIEILVRTFTEFGTDDTVRVVVLSGVLLS